MIFSSLFWYTIDYAGLGSFLPWFVGFSLGMIEPKTSCIPLSAASQQLVKCLEGGKWEFVYFFFTGAIISWLMYFFIYNNDIKLFRKERIRIILWILVLGIFDSVLGYGIYCLLSKLMYPIYQKISQISEVKLLIFFLACYIIIEIIILNRDAEYSTNQSDTLFSGFGLGNGLSWLNQGVLYLIAIIRGLNNTIVSYVLNNSLEDHYRDPLRKQLLEVLEQNNIATNVFIDALRSRIGRGNNTSLEDKLNRITKEYQDKDQDLLNKLIELATEIYTVNIIEEWRQGKLPWVK